MREPSSFRRHIELLFRWHLEGKLAPKISQSYPLRAAAEALRDLAERRVVGKVVLHTPALVEEAAAGSSDRRASSSTRTPARSRL